MNLLKIIFILAAIMQFTLFAATLRDESEPKKKIAYLVSDIRIPFWEIMSRGIKEKAYDLNYEVEIYSAQNTKKTELENVFKAIKSGVDAIIISPINSSTGSTILKIASSSNIPVVISDIGAENGIYLSYISSDNKNGAYEIGRVLAKEMKTLGWDNNGSVGIVAIPQKRENGKARTSGFMRAMKEAGIKGAGIKQQINFSYKETYQFSKELIESNQNIRALWLQGSNRYKAALDAIEDLGKKNEVLLVVFDAEPEFLELIPKGVIVGAAMQQPYLFGEKSVMQLDNYFNKKAVIKNVLLPVLPISKENIGANASTIKRNVLGIVEQ